MLKFGYQSYQLKRIQKDAKCTLNFRQINLFFQLLVFNTYFFIIDLIKRIHIAFFGIKLNEIMFLYAFPNLLIVPSVMFVLAFSASLAAI